MNGPGAASEGSTRQRRCGTLAQLLAQSVLRFPRDTAIVAPDRPPLTYAGLGVQLEAAARALAEAGYGRGTRVAVALPDGPEFAAALLSVCAVATCAPLNHGLDEVALAGLLAVMRIDALVVADGTRPAAVHAARRAAVPLLHLRFSPAAPAGTFELVAGQRRQPMALAAVMPDDIALVTHTSGTTSVPKIVPLEQWRMVEAAHSRAALAQFRSTDRSLLLTPLYSVAGIFRGLLAPLTVGGAVICPTAVDGGSVVDLLETLAPTLYSAPPAVQSAVVEEYERRSPRPHHSLRLIFSSQAELRAPLQRRLEQAFGVPVIRAYGMTETGNIAQAPLPPARAPAGSVGRPNHLEVAIADESGQFLAAGQEGEILVRGPEVFGGYENDDEANRAAFRDGWFRTGDCGHVDDDGFVFLSGRIKEMINRGGAKVAPREVEEVLERHPGVVEAAAFALPHPTLGEAVAAAVVVRDPEQVTGSELRRYARSRLAAFKVPTRVVLVGQLPRGAFGKVDRRKLAEMARSPASASGQPYADEVEAKLAGAFAEVLGIPQVGRDDSFFDLGGDSLRGVRVLVRVEQAFGISVSLDLLIDHPSVAEFAAAIRDLVSRQTQVQAGAAPTAPGSAAPAQMQRENR